MTPSRSSIRPQAGEIAQISRAVTVSGMLALASLLVVPLQANDGKPPLFAPAASNATLPTSQPTIGQPTGHVTTSHVGQKTDHAANRQMAAGQATGAQPSGRLTIPATQPSQSQGQARQPLAFPGAQGGAGKPAGSNLADNQPAAAADPAQQAVDPQQAARELTGAEPLRPARGIIETGFWAANRNWLLPVIIVAVLAACALGLYLRRRALRPAPVDQDALALQRIDAAAELADDKLFASAVADAVRHYLEARFHLRAPEQTTEEFLTDVRSGSRLPEQAVSLLVTLLELADLAKFARQGLGEQQRGKLSDCGRELVTLLSTPAQPESPQQK